MTRETDTDWIREGAKVAKWHQNYSTPHVTLATIDRLTKTQVVLADGDRYNRQTLRKVGGNWSDTLKPVSDPDVANVLARQQFSNLIYTIDEMNRQRGDSRRTGVADVLAMLDEIEQAVRAAREAITGKDA